MPQWIKYAAAVGSGLLLTPVVGVLVALATFPPPNRRRHPKRTGLASHTRTIDARDYR